MDIFVDFAYISRYLQTNISAWKYLRNCQYSGVNESYFRKPLQSPAKNMKNNYPKITLSFFTSRSVLNYFKHFKLLELSLHFNKVIQTGKKVTFLRPLSEKGRLKNVKVRNFLLVKNIGKRFSALEIDKDIAQSRFYVRFFVCK